MTPRERYRRSRRYRETKRLYDRTPRARAHRARYDASSATVRTRACAPRRAKARLRHMIRKSRAGPLLARAHDAAAWSVTRAEMIAAARLYRIAAAAERGATVAARHCAAAARQLLREAGEIWPLAAREEDG